MPSDFGTLGRLVVSLEANAAQFERDLGKMEYQMNQFAGRIDALAAGASGALKGIGLAMAGIGAGLSLSTVVDKFNSITDGLANLKAMSEKTGASVENLSALASVAKIAGVGLETVEMGAIKLAKALAGSDDTAKGAARALDYLGLSSKVLRGQDTAESMQQIAIKLEGVKDGASKVAIAMDIFGRSGAQLIPYQHDLYISGDLVAKVTDQQAEAAKRYEQDVKRLTISKDALYKTVTMSLLPAMDSLVKMFISASNEANGIRAAAKSLADDGTITRWGEKAGMAVAHVLDEFSLLKFLMIEISIPFERMGKNIETVGALASIAVTGSLQEKKQAYAELKAENEKFFADLNARSAANKLPTELYADKYRKQLGMDKQSSLSRLDSELDEIMYGGKARDSYTSRAPTDGKNARIDPYQTFIDQTTVRATGLSDGEIAKLQKQSDLLAGRSREQGFTPDTAAGASAIKQFQIASETRMTDDYAKSLAKQVQAEENKFAMVGKSAQQQQIISIQQKADLELAQKIEAEAIKLGSVTQDTQAAMAVATQQATDKMIAAANARLADERQWSTGSGNAINTYVDAITNAAAQSNKLFTDAFKGMEDALVRFVKTGKLDFKSLADSIVENLIRIQVQNSIMKPLVGTKDDPGLLSQGLSWLGSSIKGMLPSFDVGTPYVPNDMVAMIHQGERIIPAAQNTGGGDGQSVQINFNVSAIDAASFRSTLGANRNVIVGLVREAFTRRAITSPI